LGFEATPLWMLHLLTFVCETIVKRGTKNSFRGDFLAKLGRVLQMILFKVVKNQLKQEKRWLWIISDDVFTVFLYF